MIRNNRQRRALMKALSYSKSHPTADEIYRGLKEEFPNISKATVYRNLKRMTEEGQVREINIGISARYDGDTTEHYHFICKNCGSITDIRPTGKLKEIENISAMGFEAESCELYIHGVCAACREKEKI